MEDLKQGEQDHDNISDNVDFTRDGTNNDIIVISDDEDVDVTNITRLKHVVDEFRNIILYETDADMINQVHKLTNISLKESYKDLKVDDLNDIILEETDLDMINQVNGLNKRYHSRVCGKNFVRQ